MPVPKPGESKKDFIGRCVPIVISEGRPKDQSIAICYSIWKRNKKHSLLDSLYKSLDNIQSLLDKCR